MGYAIKQSQTAQPLTFMLVLSSDHLTPATGKTPTVLLSKNGGAFAAPTGAVSEISAGWYKVAGNATDSNTLGPLILNASGASCDFSDDIFQVVAYDPQTATNLGLSALPVYSPGSFSGVAMAGSNGGVRLNSDGVTDAGSGVWTANPSAFSSVNQFGRELQPMYYADIKTYYDYDNTRDEYSVEWYRGNTPLRSGAITNARISVYSSVNGAAVFENSDMSFANTYVGSLRYNNSTNLLTAGEPYHVMVSGTIDSSTRVWERIIGRSKLT